MKLTVAFVIVLSVVLIESSNSLTIYPCISKYVSRLILRIGYDLLTDDLNKDFTKDEIKTLIAREIAKDGHGLK